jgi:hypothetical protein
MSSPTRYRARPGCWPGRKTTRRSSSGSRRWMWARPVRLMPEVRYPGQCALARLRPGSRDQAVARACELGLLKG